jgi:hypothetical protein
VGSNSTLLAPGAAIGTLIASALHSVTGSVTIGNVTLAPVTGPGDPAAVMTLSVTILGLSDGDIQASLMQVASFNLLSPPTIIRKSGGTAV